jgi:hypothetical protein
VAEEIKRRISMLIEEARHVDYEEIDCIMEKHKFKFHWEVINFLVEYYKKEEAKKKEYCYHILGHADY